MEKPLKLKILVVASGNFPDPYINFPINQAFIYEQIKSLDNEITFELFLIQGRGFLGYIKNVIKLFLLKKKSKFDIIHAHYGLSGLISVLALSKNLIVTFHGSDMNNPKIRILSTFVSMFTICNIYVSNGLVRKNLFKFKKNIVIPCGVDLISFIPQDKDYSKKKLSFSNEKKYILFSSSFNNPVKNVKLAQSAISLLNADIEFLELKDKSRNDVCDLLNASDLLLLTSFSEGSPQIIKEAMACNCPIVATDVGDIGDVISETDGCYISSFDKYDVAKKIELALEFGRRTNGREKINRFDINIIADSLRKVYLVSQKMNRNFSQLRFDNQ